MCGACGIKPDWAGPIVAGTYGAAILRGVSTSWFHPSRSQRFHGAGW